MYTEKETEGVLSGESNHQLVFAVRRRRKKDLAACALCVLDFPSRRPTI